MTATKMIPATEYFAQYVPGCEVCGRTDRNPDYVELIYGEGHSAGSYYLCDDPECNEDVDVEQIARDNY